MSIACTVPPEFAIAKTFSSVHREPRVRKSELGGECFDLAALERVVDIEPAEFDRLRR